MTNFLYSRRVLYTASVVGLLSALTAHPLSAQGVTDIVRSLNAVIYPGDTQRLEDQARRNNRPAEERYWRDYRTGLETPNRSRDTGVRRDYGDRRFDPNDPRTFRSEAAINLELGRLSRTHSADIERWRIGERQAYDDRLAEDAQRRYERMTERDRQRYLDDLQNEQRRLDRPRRG